MYCDFFSIPYDESLSKRYVDALCLELAAKSEDAETLQSIYIGGGTPTILPASMLELIFDTIRRNYSVDSGAEITIEANPGTVSELISDLLPALGINRSSIGIQSFQDNELSLLGRAHNSADAVLSAKRMMASGINNLSFDLMYGIPEQSIDSWVNSLDMALDLSPQHISAYELTPEKNTPLWDKLSFGLVVMPDEESIIEMQDLAIDMLEKSGLNRYEISNYARTGSICRHNMNYWNCGEYIGVGAGASSFTGGIRSKNIASVKDYIEKTNAGLSTDIDRIILTDSDKKKELIFLGFRKTEGILISDAEKLGLDLKQSICNSDMLDYFKITDDRICMTMDGFRIANTLIIKLLDIFEL